ncbi:unnamed protein product [Adineta steineri]|uniref:Uncharacterized protein n=1 Tax=Adineta steineri TaxID=433720 RepID=A0A813QKW2_9BILA|nr:unnamed protein product [Adineta steineri]CAF0737349.1 unnamed protein product [Adineta steineri]CAF0768531.1 unnamed protein product [Adineta steineri]
MSKDPSSVPSPQKIDFAPLHRTVELENIHAQVMKNDSQQQQQQQPKSPSARKGLSRNMTVIGDGSDTDYNQLTTQE